MNYNPATIKNDPNDFLRMVVAKLLRVHEQGSIADLVRVSGDTLYKHEPKRNNLAEGLAIYHAAATGSKMPDDYQGPEKRLKAWVESMGWSFWQDSEDPYLFCIGIIRNHDGLPEGRFSD